MSSSNAQRIGCCSAASSTSRIQASRGTVLCFSINGRRAIASKAVEVAEQINSRSLNNVIIRRQVLDGNQLQKLSLTLNRRLLHPHLDVSNSPPPNGTPIPPGYHLVYFTPEGVEADLGVDGTDLTFNAPKPFTRRMWAGGELRWTKDCELKTGNVGEERTRLLKATPKRSRDGSEMVLVDVVKEFWANDKLCLVDQRSWVFRPEPDAANIGERSDVKSALLRDPSSVEDYVKPGDVHGRRKLRWSHVGLFRFSALTFNGHRIHYDENWASGVEDHRGCVVHGPLNLISMLDYWRDIVRTKGTDEQVSKISYRGLAPLYAGDSYEIRASEPAVNRDATQGLDVFVERSGMVCMKGFIVSQ